MDDQQTYLLNGLLARQFGLGRIVRFRPVERGRQAQGFEVFTAQEKEYLVQVYPAAFERERLDFAARAINALDANRFSVVPIVKSKEGRFTAEGPQGSQMMVSLAPEGSALAPVEYTEHDISQVGLRLAWMHRLLKEQLGEPQAADVPAWAGEGVGEPLASLLKLPVPQGWVHGDVQPQALLHDGDHQLRAIADWGLLHGGCPLEDLVDAFLALATGGKGELNSSSGKALLEAYDSLVSIRRVAWTPVVAAWCAQRLADEREKRRPLPEGFELMCSAPERLATAMASCL